MPLIAPFRVRFRHPDEPETQEHHVWSQSPEQAFFGIVGWDYGIVHRKRVRPLLASWAPEICPVWTWRAEDLDRILPAQVLHGVDRADALERMRITQPQGAWFVTGPVDEWYALLEVPRGLAMDRLVTIAWSRYGRLQFRQLQSFLPVHTTRRANRATHHPMTISSGMQMRIAIRLAMECHVLAPRYHWRMGQSTLLVSPRRERLEALHGERVSEETLAALLDAGLGAPRELFTPRERSALYRLAEEYGFNAEELDDEDLAVIYAGNVRPVPAVQERYSMPVADNRVNGG